MKKIIATLLSLFILTGCTIDYSNINKELIKNEDGTYTKYLSNKACTNLEVYYLDLQDASNTTKIGDSTYIKCDNIDIVIDAGTKGTGTNTVVPFLKEKVTDKKIELVIATHTDADHLGGFKGLSNKEGVLNIEGFTYDYILESGNEASSNTYSEYKELATNSNAKICTAYDSLLGNNECAKTFKMGTITLDLLDTSFYNKSSASSNNKSVVTLLTYNQVTFLFPGDLEDDEYLANNISHINIFKASHHGASSANSLKLLQTVTPDMIILSTDGDNKYDIPQQESLDRMYSVTTNIYATFVSGTIKISTDGVTYNKECNNDILFQDSTWFKENRTINN